MKKLLFSLLLLASYHVRAEIIVVQVRSFNFTPANFTAVVGDIVRFTWIDGAHTTTSRLGGIPVGAPAWDRPMNSANTTFDYTIMTPGNYTYDCTPHFGFMSGTFTANLVTPVKLINFSVKAAEKGKAVINWQTLTEDNAEYFSIQRSETGREFDEIGRVKATGSSTIPVSYSFTDPSLNISFRYYYYQLLTVDKDQKEQRSRIILYKQDVQEKKIIVRLSPNPVQSGDHLQMWFNADQEGKLAAALYDASGKLVYKDNMSASRGVNFGHLHIHDLQAGVYLLKLSIGKLQETRMITVQ